MEKGKLCHGKRGMESWSRHSSIFGTAVILIPLSCSRLLMSSLVELSMAQEEDEHSLERKFSAAVKVVESLPVEGRGGFLKLLFIYFFGGGRLMELKKTNYIHRL